MIRKKICLLGAFSVGKTSLVQRLVHSIFSERYQTTVGVRIEKKTLMLDGNDVSLVIWDLQGEDEFQKLRESYLRGSSGALLVADGTRPHTVDIAILLRDRLRDVCGNVPAELLINKADLTDEWAVDPRAVAALDGADSEPIVTSAKTGAGVEGAFESLARRILGGGA
ncbi:MAG: GTP-binding protein [bacterium]|nr:GTP-binding protein [bacterium]